MHIISGIYKIVNLKNQKCYIGSSKNITRRWYIHKSALNNNRHHSIYLQRSWNKHGASIFKFEIIKELPNATKSELFAEELKYVNELLPAYNVGGIGGGDNLTNNPNREDIIRRITASVRDRVSKMSSEERKKIWSHPGDENPNWRGGMTFCECGRRINSNSEMCIKCIDRTGENNSFYGKHHTPKTIEILRQKHLGKILSEKTKEKCRHASINFYKSNIGKQYAKEWGKKIKGKNHPLYGIGHTEKSIKKISKTKNENISKMTISERYKWNKMRKVRIVRIKDCYYLSLEKALEFYSKSAMSLRFRCDSVNNKWKDYEWILTKNFNPKQDIEMIQNLINTNIKPQHHI